MIRIICIYIITVNCYADPLTAANPFIIEKGAIQIDAPFVIQDTEDGLSIRTITNRYEIKDGKFVDLVTGKTINSTSDYRSSKRVPLMENNDENSEKIKNMIAYSTNESNMGTIVFVDPFQQESFTLLKTLSELRKTKDIAYSLILMPVSKFSAENVAGVFCLLFREQEAGLDKFLLGDTGTPVCAKKDYSNFAYGMLSGLTITEGRIPFVIQNNQTYFGEYLDDLKL